MFGPMPLSMLGVLLSSSVVLHWGERAVRRGRDATARLSLVWTIALGLAFLTMQASAYRNANGSILSVITGIHGIQVVLGLLLLAYVLVVPRIGIDDRPPRHSIKNAAVYWDVAALAWVAIVAILYLLPRTS
jgi:heme/copper-type cytochrome/quinol oxidase subunit 3